MRLLLTICALTAVAGGYSITAAAEAPGLRDILARMDQSAAQFHGMKANVKRVSHTAVLNEDSTETGNLAIRKISPHEVQGRLEIETPDKKAYLINNRTVEIFYPNLNQVEIYRIGKEGEQLTQFILLGFGTSGTDLEKNYDMKVTGAATLDGEKVDVIQLTPKGGEAKKLVTTVDLWLRATGPAYPLKERILQPSGDSLVMTYSGVQINPPMGPEATSLKLPAGVKKVYPQR